MSSMRWCVTSSSRSTARNNGIAGINGINGINERGDGDLTD